MTFTKKRLIIMGIVIVAILAGVLIYNGMQDKTPMVQLVSYKLKHKQVLQVEDYLKKNHYEYEVRGNEIYVHQDQFDEILVNMSSQGIPSP